MAILLLHKYTYLHLAITIATGKIVIFHMNNKVTRFSIEGNRSFFSLDNSHRLSGRDREGEKEKERERERERKERVNEFFTLHSMKNHMYKISATG